MKAKNLLFVVLFVLLALISTSSFNAAIAKEKGPINFVYVTDLTGPINAQAAPLGWAVEDYFKWRNEQGGINGHEVNVELVDTKYQLPLIRSAYTRIKDRKNTAISFDSLSGGIEALKEQFKKDQIPVLMITGHGPALYPPGWVIATMSPYDDALCVTADWIMANWKEKRKPRLALLLGDYASGRSPEMAKWYCEQKGIEIVGTEYVPLLPTDTSDLLIRTRDKKPDFVFDTLMPGQIKVVLRDKQRLGIKIPQVNFVFNSFLITQTVPPEAYDGYMGIEVARSWWEKDVPGIQLAYKLYAKRGPTPPYAYIAAVGAAMVWEQAVKNAIETVGYEKMDGKSIMDGFMKIKDFTAMGIYKEITYTKGDLRGNKWAKISRLNKDGSIKPVADWMVVPHNLKLKAESGK